MDSKWEQVLISWMSGKSVEYQIVPDGTTEVIARDDFQIVELEKILLEQGLIPEFLCGNNDLYMVLLRRMQLQLMYSVSVPQRRDESLHNFGGLLNSRQQILGEIHSTFAKSVLHLEKKPGVNLAYYWKIAEKEKQAKEAKQVAIQHNKKIKENKKRYFLFIHKFSQLLVMFVRFSQNTVSPFIITLKIHPNCFANVRMFTFNLNVFV